MHLTEQAGELDSTLDFCGPSSSYLTGQPDSSGFFIVSVGLTSQQQEESHFSDSLVFVC
ncbi:MAG: hypothetical protein K1W19_04635 [Lachnospiraceae bacterium]